MKILFGFLLAVSVALSATHAAFSSYRGESQLERIEEKTFDRFADPVPAKWNRPSRAAYIVATPSRGRCWPAAGKSICGVADTRHHLIAFTHYGCCVSHAILQYANPGALGLPQSDLSMVRATGSVAIGSSAAAVSRVFGAPTATRDRASGRFVYGYFLRRPNTGKNICGQWTTFVFDRSARVIAIRDSSGC